MFPIPAVQLLPVGYRAADQEVDRPLDRLS